jgi:hypothetical protein
MPSSAHTGKIQMEEYYCVLRELADMVETERNRKKTVVTQTKTVECVKEEQGPT